MGLNITPGAPSSDYEDWGKLMYPRTVTYWWMPDSVETAIGGGLSEVGAMPLGEDRFRIPADIQGTEP